MGAVAVALLALGILTVQPLSAQQHTTASVESGHACASCRVSVIREVTLGNDSDSVGAGAWNSVVRTARGEYWVATIVMQGSDHIRLYSTEGRLTRSVGRAGQGPGEFGSILHMTLGRADTAYLFEVGRVSVVSPTGMFVRLFRTQFTVRQAVASPNGSFFISAQNLTRDLAGLPVHQLSSDGQHVRSFGADPAAFDRERPSLSTRVIARAPDGTLWLARPDRYVIEKWTSNGQRIRTLTRVAEWFPPRDTEVYENGAPTPFVVGMQVAPDGRLWVLSVRDDTDWRRNEPPRGEFVPYSPADQERLFDSMIEVIDPESGMLLTSVRLPYRAGGFVDPQRIWALRETDSGLWLIDVWKLAFHQNEEGMR